METYPDQQLLRYGAIRERFVQGHEDYISAEPFPHILVDDFVSQKTVDLVLDSFPAPSADINWRQLVATGDDGNKVQFNKQGMPHLFKVSPAIRQLIWELNSGTFIRFLEKLTGIKNLIPDPMLRGGGLLLAHRLVHAPHAPLARPAREHATRELSLGGRAARHAARRHPRARSLTTAANATPAERSLAPP